MAQGDIYKLRFRIDYRDTVSVNQAYYKQISVTPQGGYATGALALVHACSTDGTIYDYWKTIGCADAEINCAVVDKVKVEGDAGPEYAYLPSIGAPGAVPEGMAPDQCLTLNLWANFQDENGMIQPYRRNLYFGGLGRNVFNGMAISQGTFNYLRNNAQKLTAPAAVAANSDFQMVMKQIKQPESVAEYYDVTNVNPPFFMTRKNSRKRRLQCI